VTPLDILRAARALIAAPGGWTQGAHARHRPDGVCGIDHPEAVAFDIGGALCRVSGAPGRPYTGADLAALDEAEAALIITCGGSLRGWNDRPERTQAEAVALFDTTITRLETTP
jgi:hypothetical protein